MPVSDYFSASYAEARDKFRAAAGAANARLSAYELPSHRGPAGEPLSVDVAVIGPATARRSLLLISGTHGAEGFCGSGCQVGFFADRLHEAFAADAARGAGARDQPVWFRVAAPRQRGRRRPEPQLRRLHAAAARSDGVRSAARAPRARRMGGPVREAADAALGAYVREHGMRAFQTAVTGGQYTRPTGLFYGGSRETWSAKTLRQIVREQLPANLETLAVIDLHTGLGRQVTASRSSSARPRTIVARSSGTEPTSGTSPAAAPSRRRSWARCTVASAKASAPPS